MGYKEIYESRPWLKFYPAGVPGQVPIPERSLAEIFDDITFRYREKTALIFYGRKITFQELREQVDRLATALHDLGIKKRRARGPLST